jgi:hypothetical protein
VPAATVTTVVELPSVPVIDTVMSLDAATVVGHVTKG